MAITTHDLNRLIHEPSPKVRSYIASKVSESFNRDQFTQNESKLAIEIFRLLLRDTATTVRRAIAENLKNSPHAPRDIVLALANDESDISVPILESSPLLNDDDLLELIRSTRELRKWLAVARRTDLSSKVSRQLVATRNEQVVVSLLGNSTADIGEMDLEYIINEFRHEQNVLEAMIYRGGLNVRFAEKLYYLVSSQLKKQLTKRYRLPWTLVSQNIDTAREGAMVRFMAPWMTNEDVTALVQQMHRNKRLSNTLIIRALCHGELRFFETALAIKAAIPSANARKLLADKGTLGFQTLCLSAGFSEEYMEALETIFRFAQQQSQTNQTSGQPFQQRLVEYIRASSYDTRVPHMKSVLQLISPADYESSTVH